MIDQNTYVNTYIEITLNTLMDQIKANLQLQTQIKFNELVIAEKEQAIANLTKQVNENVLAENWKARFEAVEVNYAAATNKLAHMDTLMKQLSEMKKMIQDRDAEIEALKSPKKTLNKKNDNVVPLVAETKKVNPSDDV